MPAQATWRFQRVDPFNPLPEKRLQGRTAEGLDQQLSALQRHQALQAHRYRVVERYAVGQPLCHFARGGKKGGKAEKVQKVGVKKEAGYLYYLDKAGDVAKAKMVNAKKKKK